MLKHIILVFSLLPILVGCLRFSVDVLDKKELKGSAFDKALAKEYLDFARSEAKQYDWVDADYFAKKGLIAAEGEIVEPEQILGWDIPDSAIPTLNEARSLLLNILTDHMKETQPAAAARAMVKFDCWLEQQEENWQTEHIDSCRNSFFETIDYLSVTQEKIVETPEEDLELEDLVIDPESFEEVEQQPVSEEEKNKHVIYFEFDSATITTGGWDVIADVIKALEGLPEYEVRLHGYADRAGREIYNMALSKRRVDAVKNALIDRGVAGTAIQSNAYGETKPPKETRDGVKEPANRIVEVFLQ